MSDSPTGRTVLTPDFVNLHPPKEDKEFYLQNFASFPERYIVALQSFCDRCKGRRVLLSPVHAPHVPFARVAGLDIARVLTEMDDSAGKEDGAGASSYPFVFGTETQSPAGFFSSNSWKVVWWRVGSGCGKGGSRGVIL